MASTMRMAGSALALAAVMMLAADVAEARPRPRQASSFSANKTFGLGLILGSPTGLSGKYFLSSSTALDFAVGDSHDFDDDDGLTVHADFLWHPVNLVATQPFYMPLYFGVGGRIREDDNGRDRDDDADVGVRVPVGIALDFNNVPLDIFFEIAVIVNIVDEDDNDDVDLDSAIGIRYWF